MNRKIAVLLTIAVIGIGCKKNNKVASGGEWVPSPFEGSWASSCGSVNLFGNGTGNVVGGSGTVNGANVSVSNGAVSGNSFISSGATGLIITGGNLSITANGSTCIMDRR